MERSRTQGIGRTIMSSVHYLSSSTPVRTRQLWSGAALRVFRRRSTWTQDSLAKRLGVSDSTWSRMEQGGHALDSAPIALAEQVLGLEPGATDQWGEWLARIHGETTGTSAWRFRRAAELIPDLAVHSGRVRMP